MNTRQLRYAVELYKNPNISHVALKLGITQPALSKQILSLENELEVKLFDRTTNPLTVTPAGEHFLKEARKLLYNEEQLLRSMEDFKSGKRGNLNIGVSPFRCLYLIPSLCEKIKEKYPNVQITLHEAGSDQLRQSACEGKFDFAIVNLPVDESVLDVVPIESDALVLAVPELLCNKINGYSDTTEKIELSQCSNLPFVVVGQSQEMRQLFEKSCAAANITPKISVEVVGLASAWAMCRQGLGATILPKQFVNNMCNGQKIKMFTLKHSVRSRQPAVITRKGQYISEYAEYAIKLLSEQTS
ncbi:MAG: LysR family transcriptional regulator [Clostridia bacterium]|nr:LysR family transcriptional regulator [Clostridia bacterium]